MGSYIGAFGQEKHIPWEIPELVKAPSEEKIESVQIIIANKMEIHRAFRIKPLFVNQEVDPVDSWGSLITPTQSQADLASAAKKEKAANTRKGISTARAVQSDLLRIASSLSLR